MKYALSSLFIIPFLCSSCTAPTAAMTSAESQLMVRQAQTREFEQVSKKQAMRASIATLQDLDFIIDKVDADLGAISGSKFQWGNSVKITVTIREKSPLIVTVRANASYGEKSVEDPLIYQDFFALLSKSLFLVKNQID